MDARELYRAGRLTDAIDAMNGMVRDNPADLVHRGFLSELLCIAGNLDRADTQLEVVTNQQPEAAVGVSLVRQLIRAAKSRQEFFAEGRVPDVLADPTESMRLQLEASVRLRGGDAICASELLAEAEEKRPVTKGVMSGQPFDDIRDLDDLLGGMLEVLTSTGKYFWVPMETIERLAPRQPERPLDLHWLPAEISVTDGPDGVVYLPTVYGTRDSSLSDEILLGRSTEWSEEGEGVVRGTGLRAFLVGEEAKTVFELGELTFESSAS